jgi:CHAT domain-containing protein
LPFVANGSNLYLSYMTYLIHEGRVEEALKVLDQGRAETLAERLIATPMLRGDEAFRAPFHPSERARRLNAVILTYCLQPGTSYLWAIDARSIHFFRLPGKETLIPLIDSFNRAVLSSRDVLAQQDAPALSLYRYLVEPANRIIPPGGTVFIVGDEGLYSLNFETLLTSNERPHFWIEDVNIINARSLSLLPAGPPPFQAGASQKRLLLLGEPINNHQEYERLPHAREEIASVAKHFSPSRRVVLTGLEATPDAYLLSQPADYAYIHFVTHAVANNVDPLDSAVILSASADVAQTYKLYAREILNQRLHADLVTISACYGSGIESYSGEGLVGLAWAFLRAGSHNVVGALWEVSDASTPLLMGDFYDGLVGGSSPAVALRSAKLNMLHQGGIFRKPFYWASFQLYTGP